MSNETKPSRSVPMTGGATTARRLAADDCGRSDCAPGSSADVLNQTCYSVTFDVSRVRQTLHTEFGDVFPPAVWTNHEHLFSASPAFVDQESLGCMAGVVAAVEEVVRTPSFQDAVMGWAPEVARFDPGPLGGLLSYDFHLAAPAGVVA